MKAIIFLKTKTLHANMCVELYGGAASYVHGLYPSSRWSIDLREEFYEQHVSMRREMKRGKKEKKNLFSPL